MEKYDVICFRCSAQFVSPNLEDTFGDGECSKCKEKTRSVAIKVDKIMAQRKANSLPVQSKKESIMPGTNYINARNLI